MRYPLDGRYLCTHPMPSGSGRPDTLPGIVDWWIASAGYNPVAPSWTSQAGRASVLTGSNTSLLNPWRNGRPAVNFLGADWLGVDIGLPTINDYTFGLVGESTGGGYFFCFQANFAFFVQWGQQLFDNGGPGVSWYQDEGAGTSIVAATGQDIMMGDAAGGVGTQIVWLNGTASAATNIPVMNNDRAVYLGISAFSAGNLLTGNIAEVAIWSPRLSTANRNLCKNYWSTYYNIAVV